MSKKGSINPVKFRIVEKEYNLVSPTGETIVVKAPRQRGINRDQLNGRDAKARNAEGQLVRNFYITDTKSVQTFKDKTDVLLIEDPTQSMPYTIIDGVRWDLKTIDGVRASRPRQKKTEDVTAQVHAQPVTAEQTVVAEAVQAVETTPEVTTEA